MPKDKPAHLQTPILQSVKDQLYELKDRLGHNNTGETIGWLIDETKEQRKPLGDLISELDGMKDEHTRTES